MGPTQTCAIRSETGALVCLSRGVDYDVPATLGSVTSVAFGTSVTCALQAEHKRTCWGSSIHPPIPLGTSIESFSFLTDNGSSALFGIRSVDGSLAAFPNGSLPAGSFLSVAASSTHGCAIRTADHRVECWGSNAFGQAPPGPSVEEFEEIAAGDRFTCGVRRADGRLRCWGENQQAAASPFSVKSISARGATLCALRVDDSTEVCGTSLWTSERPLYLKEALRSIAVNPASNLSTTPPGSVCFVKGDGHIGCR